MIKFSLMTLNWMLLKIDNFILLNINAEMKCTRA